MTVTILQAMHNHAHSANIQTSACRLLLRMQGNDRSIGDGHVHTTLAGQDFIQALLQTTQHHPDDSKVQNFALNCLSDLTYVGDFEVLETLAGQDFIQAVLRAMQNHPDDSELQKSALTFFGNAELYFYSTLASQDCIQAVLQAMQNHPDDSEVQKFALEYLCLVLISEQDEPLQTTLAGQDCNQAIMQATQNHPDDSELERSVLDFLMVLENVEGAYSLPHIVQAGGVEFLLQNASFPALAELFEINADARRAAIEGDAIPILLNLLRPGSNFRDRRLVVRILIVLFFENANAMSLRIASEGGIEAIVHFFTSSFADAVDRTLFEGVAMFPCDDGMLPLHHAAGWPTNSRDSPDAKIRLGEIVDILLEVYPEAVTIWDNFGQLPLHVAIRANGQLSILEAMLHVNPVSGVAVCRCRDDAMANFPPAILAAASDCDLESIFVLLRHDPGIMPGQGT
jgi:hypothetical protein